MRFSRIGVAILIAIGLSGSGSAAAEELKDFGDRWSLRGGLGLGTVVQGNISPHTIDNELSIALGGGYTTGSGRHQFGVDLLVIATSSDPYFFPVATYRMNSDLFGPGDSMLLYGGAAVGASVQQNRNSQTAVIGPLFGYEWYFTKFLALQLEDQVHFETDGGMQNHLIGSVKFVFP